jgi:hypothetical protein
LLLLAARTYHPHAYACVVVCGARLWCRYLEYGALFRAIRGKQWVLTPHAVNCTGGGGAKANAFDVGPRAPARAAGGAVVRQQRVWPVMLGAANATATLTATAPPAGCATLDTIVPGAGEQWREVAATAPLAVRGGATVQVNVSLGTHGCALVRCTPPEFQP